MRDYTRLVLDDLYLQAVSGSMEFPNNYSTTDKCDFLSALIGKYKEFGEFEKCKELNNVMEKL